MAHGSSREYTFQEKKLYSAIEPNLSQCLNANDNKVSIHLNGVQSSHVHLQQAVFPVHSGDPAVVDAPGYVAEFLAILEKAVVFVVHAE